MHILVLETRTGDVIRTRRTTYFALQTAQAALDRATARGHVASLILCKLVPVDGGA
ncbi:hypothetical protein [Arthrobacter rhombi]|uniref:hypothetical protein n=1 Tax=Arthrobacter rhombi TaxID=71253 RepID=UPI003FD5C704